MDRPRTPAERPDLYRAFWHYAPFLGTPAVREGWGSSELLLPSILAANDEALERLCTTKRTSAPRCWPATPDELRIVRYCTERVRDLWRSFQHGAPADEIYVDALRRATIDDPVMSAVASWLTVGAPYLEPAVTRTPRLRGTFRWALGWHQVLWELASVLAITTRRCLLPSCTARVVITPGAGRWDVLVGEPYCEEHSRRDRADEARERRIGRLDATRDRDRKAGAALGLKT
jgi:hypothetical protein